MAKKRIIFELGQGTSLRQEDYSKAAVRAVKDALWRNSVNVSEAFGLKKSDMIVEVLLGAQEPDKIDKEMVKAIFPYGSISIKNVFGGLDVAKPNDGGKTVIVTAAIIVSLNVERAI